MTVEKVIKLAANIGGWRILDGSNIRRYADYGKGRKKFRECPLIAVANHLAVRDNKSLFAIGQEKWAGQYLGLNRQQRNLVMNAADNDGEKKPQVLRAKMLKAFKLEK